MFTGIIQSIGSIKNIKKENNSYIINTNLDLNDCIIGSSICCDGICLTIVRVEKNNNLFEFEVNVGEETLSRTNIVNWNTNTKVNLEKSLKVGDELSGHFVYGHIDTTLKINKIKRVNGSWEFFFALDSLNQNSKLKKLIVEKGSIAINGISLTVANVFEDSFVVSIIPHTFENTNLSLLKEIDSVNVEFDPIARYISKYYGN